MKDSDSDNGEEDEESDGGDKKERKKRDKESNLFTKIGVPQKDEEEMIKKQFKMQAEKDGDGSSDDADDFL